MRYIFLLVTLLSSGCMRIYCDGERVCDKPIEHLQEIAVLHVKEQEGCKLKSIDCKKLTGKYWEYHLRPGQHKISASFRMSDRRYRYKGEVLTIEESFKGGRVYTIGGYLVSLRSYEGKGKWTLGIRDEGTVEDYAPELVKRAVGAPRHWHRLASEVKK